MLSGPMLRESGPAGHVNCKSNALSQRQHATHKHFAICLPHPLSGRATAVGL